MKGKHLQNGWAPQVWALRSGIKIFWCKVLIIERQMTLIMITDRMDFMSSLMTDASGCLSIFSDLVFGFVIYWANKPGSYSSWDFKIGLVPKDLKFKGKAQFTQKSLNIFFFLNLEEIIIRNFCVHFKFMSFNFLNRLVSQKENAEQNLKST